MRQFKQKDLKPLRAKMHKQQGGVCPVLGIKVSLEDTVCDHCHANKAYVTNPKHSTLIRGIIQRYANSFEGKVVNTFIRMGLFKYGVSLVDVLRNLADYLENPPLVKYEWIHPSEKEKPRLLKKSSYNKLVKLSKKKVPPYPKSKKLTVPLREAYITAGLEPEYYKGRS